MSRLPARRRSPSPSRARWRSVNSDSIREGVVGADVNHAVLPAGNAARSTVTTANLDSTDSEFLIPNSITPFQFTFHGVEHRPRQFLRHPLADRAAFDERRAGHRFERNIPAIAR